MQISSVKIKNYKSYFEPPALFLSSGINIVVGKNNVGKTSLLEGIGTQINFNPHKTINTIPIPSAPLTTSSLTEVTFVLTPEQWIEFCYLSQQDALYPVPEAGSDFAESIGFIDYTPESFQKLLAWFYAHPVNFSIIIEKKHTGEEHRTFPSTTPYRLSQNHAHINLFKIFKKDGNDNMVFSPGHEHSRWKGHQERIWEKIKERIYSFKAERFNAGKCNFGANTILKSDASNLAEVLRNLQQNPVKFQNYLEKVRLVFPQLKNVSIMAINNQEIEILIWNHSPHSQRVDLAIPLNESGTGIGQVLAILYVVLNSDFPQVIIIDEPQSFLHRGAARKLIEILKAHPEHQYIIATHSPTIISASDPKTITIIKNDEGISSYETLDIKRINDQRYFLEEVGAKISDIFGGDNVLWVEGPTEEKCFPVILEKLGKRSLMGTILNSVISTGDLEGKHAKKILEIYNRISESASILPPALGFIFDDEGRTDAEKEELIKLSKGLVSFLPRRMYENYLLNSKAIADVISKELEIEVSHENVLESLNKKNKDKKYFKSNNSVLSRGKSEWLKNIHGANILKDIFIEVSENKLEFSKVKHSFLLTEWLIQNSPAELDELLKFLEENFDK